MLTYLCIFFGSAYLAVFITPLVIRLAKRIGAVDRPGIRSVHTHPIPRIGGVAIFASAMCVIVPLLFLNNRIGEWFWEIRVQVATLLGAATVVFVIGLIDDLRGLPARVKFAVESFGALALCFVGVRIGSIGLGEGFEINLGWLSCPITVLWIVGVTNAVNMSDGLDGLAAGVAAIACGVIAVFALYSSTIHTGGMQANDVMMALFSLALLGGLCGFLFFNFNPAKIFMGDCGSLFIGFTIAAASVMCVSKSTALVGLALPALALGIPIFDTLFSMLRRFLERRSLFAPDHSHFHHRLLDLGFTQRHAVILIYAATLGAVGIGLFMMVRNDLTSLIVFGGALLLIIVPFRLVGAVRLGETVTRLREKYQQASHERDDRKDFEYLQLRFRKARDENQWRDAICETAHRMSFAWVSLKTVYEDGRVEEELWRPPDGKPDLSKIVLLTIPVGKNDSHTSRHLEVAILADDSMEGAGRRASLLGRLIDESGWIGRKSPDTGAIAAAACGVVPNLGEGASV